MIPQAGTAVGRRPARSRFPAAVSSGVRSSWASRSLAELHPPPPPSEGAGMWEVEGRGSSRASLCHALPSS